VKVQKYIIVDNRKTVKIYLNKSGVENHRDELKKGVTGKINEDGPHMYFKITSGEAFQKDMSEFYKNNPTVKEVPSDVDNERDWFGGALQFLLPILLFYRTLDITDA
jgi:cell division protease FtsH